MAIFLSQWLREKAEEAILDMIAKGTDKEEIPDAACFYVSMEKRRLCLGTIEVDGKQYYVCQKT